MPSRAGQEELLLRLHRDIGVEPNETSFVEVSQCVLIFGAIRSLRSIFIECMCGELNFGIGSWDWNADWVSVLWRGLPRPAQCSMLNGQGPNRCQRYFVGGRKS